MKSLFYSLSDLSNNKLNLISNYIKDNNIDNLYVYVSKFNKDKLSELISFLDDKTNIMIFLDTSSSYNLSVKDLNDLIIDRKNINFSFEAFYTIKYKNTNINLVTDIIDKEDIVEFVDLDSLKYEVFIIKDNKYKFDFKIFPNTKGVFISIPYINKNNEIVLIERNNGVVEGSSLKIDKDYFDKTILFKI